MRITRWESTSSPRPAFAAGGRRSSTPRSGLRGRWARWRRGERARGASPATRVGCPAHRAPEPVCLAAGETVEEIVAGYQGRVSREAVLEAVRLAAEQFAQNLPALEPTA